MQPETSNPVEPPTPPVNTQPATCENCGAPLYGKYCHACGQPTQGLVRHFGSVLSDVADSVFNIDERLFRSIGPLYLRPGKLTLDYFAGKRARYVTPFRLVFFLAIIAFFAIQLTVRAGFVQPVAVSLHRSSSGAVSLTTTTPPKVDKDTHFSHGNIRLNNQVIWNQQSHPLQVGWLPGVVNTWLNGLIANARQQLHAMNSGSGADQRAARHKFMIGMFSAAPTVLFILLPLFALLLKIFYIFKRRLYMEHLIVAMHSHAFLMLSMLVLLVLGLLRHWIVPHAGWMSIPFTLLHVAAWVWVFIYLWLMQKRVYRQGWFMTNVKYFSVGFCYTILAGFGFAFAALLSLTGA